MRASTLQNTNLLAVNREIGSKYDVVKAVSEHLVEIEQLAAEDIEGLIASLNEAKDFTGITVVGGTSAGWDAVSKVLTVPTVKGDTGAQGLQGEQGIQGIQGAQGLRGPTGLKGDKGDRGIQGPSGLTGAQGLQGPAGVDGLNLTVEQIVYNNDGTFTWHFSDETIYTTPDLRGPQGVTGDKGDKGDQGISVHHLKGTSTTDPEGDFGTFGELDTYTFYGDASETINLGYFTVRNGITPEMTEGLGIMKRSTYDTNGNGIVDNSERLEGKVAAEFVNVEDAQDIGGTKTFTSDVVIQGNLTIHGTETVVNSETVTTKDNQIVINDGEVGAGVTAGKAGIKVDRGTEPDYEFVFIEADDSFKIGKEGELQKVATREDTPIDTGLATWDASTSRFVTSRDVDVDSVSLGNGVLTWNPDEGTLDIDTGTGVIIQAGQENNRVVRNGTGSPIVNGTVVMVTGTIGNSGRLVVAPASGVAGIAMRVYGVATQDILAGQDGYVTIDGKVRGLNTTGSAVGEVWVDGDVLYVKPNDDGNLTKVVPTYGQLKMPVANVIHAHTNGTLEVRVTPIDENAYEPSNSNIQGHIIDTSNPHGVTKAQVGLGNVDNTSDVTKNVLSATKLTTPRTIIISGEVAGSVSFDGSTDINISTTVQPNSVALGTDTTGNYVNSVVAGAGITVTGVVGEGWTPSIAITPVGTSGTYTKVSTNDKGQVVSGESLTANDIPNLDASKITSGIIDAARLPAYVDDVLEYASLSVFPVVGESGKIYIALDTNKAYRWSGSTYVYITSGAVDSVAGKTGVVTLVKADVGLANVDNTSDANKPVSTATQTALDLKANTSSLGTLATVSPTGTADNTKFLRGDNSWQVVAVTPTAVSDQDNTSTGYFKIPVGTTAQRPSSASIGMIRYNTNIEALENYTSYGWTRVSVPMPIINSVTNYIYSGYQSTITLNGINFETTQGIVTFISGATTVNVNATPTNDTAVSILVPSSIYSLASGTTVSIKYTNADDGVSSQFNVTVASIPTGGTVTTSGGYIYHTFNASSTNFVTPASWTTKTVSYLCVAGGGGGGSRYGGGGGGGGYISSTYSVAPSSTYTVIVGSGGAGGQMSAGNASTGGVNGSNSSVFGATAIGGGGGGSADVEQTGKSGGSGGGGLFSYYGGSGTSGQGNKGGDGGSVSGSGTYQYEEGGGGGAGAAGENGNTTTGQGSRGGVGLQWFNGSYYAGGGGGGSHNPAYVGYVAAGGNGGGGNSGTHGYKSPGVNASANTGGGGGGSATDTGGDSTTIGGNGGSGIVIIRYSL